MRMSRRVVLCSLLAADGGGEVLSADGRVRSGQARDDCVAIREDTLDGRVRWKASDVIDASADAVRLRFVLERCDLYSFWIERRPRSGQR